MLPDTAAETWADRPALLAGLIGTGIAASLTPAMHEREGAEQGLRLIYHRIDLTALGLEQIAGGPEGPEA